jgi:ferredoxin-NADP reductase
MLAGGSGITPIMSILHTALLSSDEIDFHLLYANRRWESIIFRERLERLEREHPGRLHILHVLEEPGPDTAAEVGRVHERQLQKWLSHSARSGDGVEYFLCGPAGMMDVARTSFEALGVDPERVRSESFQSPTVQKSTAEVTTPQTCIFEVDGTENRVMVASGQTLLEAGLDAGLSLPFSCALGGCGACRVKVVAGQVALQEPNCLTKEERDAGHALICVGRPTGPVRVKVEGPSHD